jgi:hypothetical protein
MTAGIIFVVSLTTAGPAALVVDDVRPASCRGFKAVQASHHKRASLLTKVQT